MSLLVRKINLAKWAKNNGPAEYNCRADAITGCLRTSSDKLSLWKINSDSESELEKVITALIGTMNKIDTFDIVLIDEEILNKKNFCIENEDGHTFYEYLKEYHVNITQIDLKKLLIIKNIIVEAVKNNKNIRVTKKQHYKILKNTIDSGKIKFDNLEDGRRKDFLKHKDKFSSVS